MFELLDNPSKTNNRADNHRVRVVYGVSHVLLFYLKYMCICVRVCVCALCVHGLVNACVCVHECVWV